MLVYTGAPSSCVGGVQVPEATHWAYMPLVTSVCWIQKASNETGCCVLAAALPMLNSPAGTKARTPVSIHFMAAAALGPASGTGTSVGVGTCVGSSVASVGASVTGAWVGAGVGAGAHAESTSTSATKRNTSPCMFLLIHSPFDARNYNAGSPPAFRLTGESGRRIWTFKSLH